MHTCEHTYAAPTTPFQQNLRCLKRLISRPLNPPRGFTSYQASNPFGASAILEIIKKRSGGESLVWSGSVKCIYCANMWGPSREHPSGYIARLVLWKEKHHTK